MQVSDSCVIHCDLRTGLHLSLDFFEDVFVPEHALPAPSFFDEVLSCPQHPLLSNHIHQLGTTPPLTSTCSVQVRETISPCKACRRCRKQLSNNAACKINTKHIYRCQFRAPWVPPTLDDLRHGRSEGAGALNSLPVSSESAHGQVYMHAQCQISTNAQCRRRGCGFGSSRISQCGWRWRTRSGCE